METDKTDFIISIMLLLIVAGFVFLVVRVTDTSRSLSRNEICQKYFGKDYVYVNNGRSADFCVDNSGTPKYPKSWSERRHQ
jgi:hypothetical protein